MSAATDGAGVVDALAERFGDDVVERGEYGGQHWVRVRIERLHDVASWLRDDDSAAFDFLVDVTAVHWPERDMPFELVYHLFSYARNDRLRLKVDAADGQPVPTLAGLWKSADWNERETFDMFGIRFEGHPDQRRILMPDDYTDFPLRKEFPLYRG